MSKEWDLVVGAFIPDMGEQVREVWKVKYKYNMSRSIVEDVTQSEWKSRDDKSSLSAILKRRKKKYVEQTSISRTKTKVDKKSMKGLLLLTNKRLVFFTKHGILRKGLRREFEIGLHLILGVSFKGMVKKVLIISTHYENYEFSMKKAREAAELIHG